MIERLPNGLTLGFRQMPGRQTVRICVASRISSRHEKKTESGLTHFCEHVLLGGTKEIDSQTVKREIELLGGGLNAFTAHDMVSIEGDFAEQDFCKALDLLGDLFFHPAFSRSFVEQERKVILQEIAESLDDPWETVSQEAYDLFYHSRGVGAGILGSADDVKGFKTRQLRNHWKNVSATGNCIIYVVGNISEANMDYARERYGHLPQGPGITTKKTKTYKGKRGVSQKEKDQVYISILFEAPPLEDHVGRIETEVLSSILGEGMNSRIWKSVREKMGAAYDARSSAQFFRKNGHLELVAALAPKKWEMAMDGMIDELRKIAEKGPTKKEVGCAVKGLIRSATIMGDDPLTLSSTDIASMCFGQKEFSFDNRKELISKITQKDVRNIAARIFEGGEPTIQVLGPVDPDYFS